MPYDAELQLRDGTSDLTATETGSFVTVDQPGPGLQIVVLVPEHNADGDTLDVVIDYSTDGSTAEGTKLTFPQITGASSSPSRYALGLPQTSKAITHMRAVLTVAGSTPDYGAVTVEIGKASLRSD